MWIRTNFWSEIESESDGEFLEDLGIVEQVTPTSEDGTINPIDILSLMRLQALWFAKLIDMQNNTY